MNLYDLIDEDLLDVYLELYSRYNAPGGVLPSDPDQTKRAVAESLGVTVEALER